MVVCVLAFDGRRAIYMVSGYYFGPALMLTATRLVLAGTKSSPRPDLMRRLTKTLKDFHVSRCSSSSRIERTVDSTLKAFPNIPSLPGPT